MKYLVRVVDSEPEEAQIVSSDNEYNAAQQFVKQQKIIGEATLEITEFKEPVFMKVRASAQIDSYEYATPAWE